VDEADEYRAHHAATLATLQWLIARGEWLLPRTHYPPALAARENTLIVWRAWANTCRQHIAHPAP
jgi:hypothetical protein